MARNKDAGLIIGLGLVIAAAAFIANAVGKPLTLSSVSRKTSDLLAGFASGGYSGGGVAVGGIYTAGTMAPAAGVLNIATGQILQPSYVKGGVPSMPVATRPTTYSPTAGPLYYPATGQVIVPPNTTVEIKTGSLRK
jgi:hypothetical protein